jgi:hypothetical protein
MSGLSVSEPFAWFRYVAFAHPAHYIRLPRGFQARNLRVVPLLYKLSSFNMTLSSYTEGHVEPTGLAELGGSNTFRAGRVQPQRQADATR